jgi:hypothetical protein
MTELPEGWLAENTSPVGYADMGGRPAFKMTVKEVDGRWLLYTSHFWHSGWSILDVTDPASPELLDFIAGPANTATYQIEQCGSLMVTSLEKIFSSFGGDPDVPNDEGAVLWSLEDPLKPRRLSQFHTGGEGTHRNAYTGGQYVHLAANMAGYAGNIYVILDVGDPENPVEAGRWWVPGQHVAGGEEPAKPGTALHGPVVPVGDIAYLPYGSAGVIVLDISDVSSPALVSELSFSPPFRMEFGVHSIVPDTSRGVAYVNSEGVRQPKGTLPPQFEGADHVSVIDISDPANLALISMFPPPRPPAGAPYADFYERPGWCGPHNQNQLHHNPDVAPQDYLVYLASFNAGLRIYDVSAPRLPAEVAWFLPPDPQHRYGPLPTNELVVQSEDVLVDRRGYIYVSDKNQGIWIVQTDL